MSYPPGWPTCPGCGRPVLDGKRTCGDISCTIVAALVEPSGPSSITERERELCRLPIERSCCVDAATLRQALAEIERAEASGFQHCMAVLVVDSTSHELVRRTARYSDLWERASLEDGRLDWGRGQDVTRRFRFDGERIVPVEPSKKA